MSLKEDIKTAAYHLWMVTEEDNTLKLWTCAEDIADYFKEKNFLDERIVFDIIRQDKESIIYKNFIRNISYRLFIYTNEKDSFKNWYRAEKLIRNREWLNSIIKIANDNRLNK